MAYPKKRVAILSGVFLLFLVSVVLASAEQDMPIGLQKILDFNKKNAEDFALKVGFFAAFLAGILGILSPCILPFLPAYFSYTFKEKRNITKMTFVFFSGFSLVFISMGAIAGLIGSQTLAAVQKGWLVSIVGAFMIMLGILSLKGKQVCSYINIKSKFRNDVPGTFLFGMFFAFGWTACLGPVLAGILGIGAILGNLWQSMLLLFFYSLGNLVPLFLLSVFYDRFNFSESKFIRGKWLKMRAFGRSYQVHSTNLISGLLLIIIGLTLLFFKGTSIINQVDLFGTRPYFYSVQRQLIEWQHADLAGIAALVLIALVIAAVLWKKKSRS